MMGACGEAMHGEVAIASVIGAPPSVMAGFVLVCVLVNGIIKHQSCFAGFI